MTTTFTCDDAVRLLAKTALREVVRITGEERVARTDDVAQAMGLPREWATVTLKSMRNAGLVKLTVAFDLDTATPCGSGYFATSKGATVNWNAMAAELK